MDPMYDTFLEDPGDLLFFRDAYLGGTRFSQTWKAKVTCMLHLLKMSLQNRLV